MAAINGHRSDRELTRALIERIARGDQGAALHSQVAAWRPGASVEHVEEALQEACLRAARGCHGQTVGEVFAWLRTTARRELARIHGRARRELLVDAAELARHAGIGVAAGPEDELIEREDDARWSWPRTPCSVGCPNVSARSPRCTRAGASGRRSQPISG